MVAPLRRSARPAAALLLFLTSSLAAVPNVPCSSFWLRGFADFSINGEYERMREDELLNGADVYMGTRNGYYIFYCDSKGAWVVSNHPNREINAGNCFGSAMWAEDGAKGNQFRPGQYDVRWKESGNDGWVVRNISYECTRNVVTTHFVVNCNSTNIGEDIGAFATLADRTMKEALASKGIGGTVYPITVLVCDAPGGGAYPTNCSSVYEYMHVFPSPSPEEGTFMEVQVWVVPAAASVASAVMDEMGTWGQKGVSIGDCPILSVDPPTVARLPATDSTQPSPSGSSSSSDSSLWVIPVVVALVVLALFTAVLVACAFKQKAKYRAVDEKLEMRETVYGLSGSKHLGTEHAHAIHKASLSSPSSTTRLHDNEYKQKDDTDLISCASGNTATVDNESITIAMSRPVPPPPPPGHTLPRELTVESLATPRAVYELRGGETHNGGRVWRGSEHSIFMDKGGLWRVGDIRTGQAVLKTVDPQHGTLPHECSGWYRAPVKDGESSWVSDPNIFVSPSWSKATPRLWVAAGLEVDGMYVYCGERSGQPCWHLEGSGWHIFSDSNGHWKIGIPSSGEGHVKSSVAHNGVEPHMLSESWMRAPQDGEGPGWVRDKAISVTSTPAASTAPQKDTKKVAADLPPSPPPPPPPQASPPGTPKGAQSTSSLPPVIYVSSKIEESVGDYHLREGETLEETRWVGPGFSIFSDKTGRWKVGNPATQQGLLKTAQPHGGEPPHKTSDWLRAPTFDGETDWVNDPTTSVGVTAVRRGAAPPSLPGVLFAASDFVDIAGKYKVHTDKDTGQPYWRGPVHHIFLDRAGCWKVGDRRTGMGTLKSKTPSEGKQPHQVEQWLRAPVREGETDWVEDSTASISLTKPPARETG